MKDLTANKILAYKADTLRTEKVVKTWMKWRPAILTALAFAAVGLVSAMFKGLYEPYTDELIVGHVALFMLFMFAVLGGLAVMAGRDLSSRLLSTFRDAAFSWRPGEAYLAGKRRNQKKEEKGSEKKKE